MPWVGMEEIVESYGALVARSGPETGKENAGYAWGGEAQGAPTSRLGMRTRREDCGCEGQADEDKAL